MSIGDGLGVSGLAWVKRAIAVLHAQRWLTWLGAIVLVGGFVGATLVFLRLADDEPVRFSDIRDHFKYGSTGGERGWKQQLGFGIPYWIWVAMPELFPEYLPDRRPGRGYVSLGMIYEEGRDPRFDLPIGMSMRRVMGVDRVYFTCSACHTGSVRDAPGAPRRIVLGMPANVLNFGAVGEFIRRSAYDWRFRAGRLLPRIQELERLRDREHPTSPGYRPAPMGWVDRAIFNYAGISMMRDQLLALMGRLSFMDFLSWGPGRVDTFNPPKALLGFRMTNASARELVGVADFPSVWNQGARKGMWLHWDGNNCSVDERNLSAGFGTGATPATIDREGVLRIADWLWADAQPPAFPPDRIDAALAAEGAPVYQEYCRSCHGEGASPFRRPGDGGRVGTVTPVTEVGTDPSRLDSYTPELSRAQNTLYAAYPDAGEDACREYIANVCNAEQNVERYRLLRARCYPARFSHFRKTFGYANMPLDGLWLRAPYLHNGSVPTLRALLEPSSQRPAVFYTGYDVYDYADVGFVTRGPDAEAQGWRFDTATRGNGNAGHEGAAYGTLLTPAQKNALVEYLKTF